MVLAVLTMAAAGVDAEEPRADDELPLGFLEFLGGMVEVESPAGARLIDPLDFEGVVEQQPARLEWDEPVESEHVEEVSP